MKKKSKQANSNNQGQDVFSSYLRHIHQAQQTAENKLLAYHHRLCQAHQVADPPGKVLLEKEVERVKGKILFTESWGGQH